MDPPNRAVEEVSYNITEARKYNVESHVLIFFIFLKFFKFLSVSFFKSMGYYGTLTITHTKRRINYAA